MKNSFLKNLSITSIIAITASLGVVSTFAGGNAAQGTKGATLLMQSKPAAVATVEKMNCPKCKDELITRTANEKGQFKSSYTVKKHLCPTCEQTVVTTGVGKNAQTSTQHSCGEVGGCMARK
jgi:predicted RNA-binding Zn-ribbon protein involved in translation (DUF1610 family)